MANRKHTSNRNRQDRAGTYPRQVRAHGTRPVNRNVPYDSVDSWAKLPEQLVRRYSSFGGAFIEPWYTEFVMQNYPDRRKRVTYSGPSDAIQAGLGGVVIYQNIAGDLSGGSMDFFVKNRTKLRPIGGHDVDMLVIDPKKLEFFLSVVGYVFHKFQNRKFAYRPVRDPYTGQWMGITNKRTRELVKSGKLKSAQSYIQYDLFRGMKASAVDMTGCESKLRKVRAFGIDKFNLSDEDLILTKAQIINQHGFIQVTNEQTRLKALRPKDYVDLMNLFVAVDSAGIDPDYFAYRMKLNMKADGNPGFRGRKVGEVDGSTPYTQRTVDQRVSTLFKTLNNQASNGNLKKWTRQRLFQSGYTMRDIDGLLFDWNRIEQAITSVVPVLVQGWESEW